MTPLWVALALDPLTTPTLGEPDKDTATTPAIVTEASAETDPDSPALSYLFTRPPALSALGNDTTKFDEPGTPMDFAISIGDFFSESGALKAGGAVEVGARGLGLTRRVTAEQYRRSYGLRTLSHSYLSLATSKREVTDADDDVMVSTGLRVALFHGGDPLMAAAYAEAVDAVEAACSARTAADPSVDPVKCRTDAYPALAQAIPDPRWNAAGVVLSGAFVGAFLGGRYSAFQAEEASVWLTGTVGLDDWGQLGLAAAWTQNLAGEAHTFSPTLRFRAGLGATRITAEGAWLLGLPTDGGVAHRYRASLGGEFRVQAGSWVNGSFGLEIDPTKDLVTLLGGLSFRWGQADAPTFMPEAAEKSPASDTGKATTAPTR